MPDVAVFMVANLEIDDPDRYRQYEKGFFPILKRHGGEFVTFDDRTRTLEGASPPPGRMVIFRLDARGENPPARIIAFSTVSPGRKVIAPAVLTAP